MGSIGQMALIGMFSHLMFIYITWRLMITINFEPLIRKGGAKQAQVLILFLTIVIGTGVSNFFLDFLQWSKDLLFLF